MANHTSPIDVIILASDGYYAMVRVAPTLASSHHTGSFSMVPGLVPGPVPQAPLAWVIQLLCAPQLQTSVLPWPWASPWLCNASELQL